MEELYLRSLLLGGSSSLFGLDVPTLLALLAVALVYFLAPCAGYRTSLRGALLGALWVLVGKVAAGMMRLAVLFYVLRDTKLTMRTTSSDGETILMLFALLEAGLFLLAMILFVVGLAGLRRSDDAGPPLGRRPYTDD
jgi:hypothetical protein